MKTLAWSILFLVLVHLLAGGIFAGWLWQTGRVDAERLQRAVDVFRVPIADEQRLAEEAARLEAEAQEMAARAARLEAVADGPKTLGDRLALDERADELAIHRAERLQRETDDLKRQIDRAKELLAKQKQELEAERQAFDAFVTTTTQRMQEEDFLQAVAMYEQLKPRQAKQMFQQLMSEGKTKEVVDYLAAMQLRKAAGVLKEFKAPAEIEQATMLIEALGERGVYPDGAVAEAVN